jgi:hypothetical protein
VAHATGWSLAELTEMTEPELFDWLETVQSVRNALVSRP